MHKLGRSVRFSINPFLDKDNVGFNSFCSKPAGKGLAIFLELGVELTGDVDRKTGFVVNVSDIDDCVRQYAIPVFAERIRAAFSAGKHITILEIAKVLHTIKKELAKKFKPAKLSRLSLNLNPFRKVEIDCEDCQMIYFSEKFEFAAMHKLWNDEFSEEKNLQVFGKCANPTGHGHNYIVEVTVKASTGSREFGISDFEKAVNDKLIEAVDHRNLNIDVGHFAKTNPTVENIAAFAWEKLVGSFGKADLHCVTLWETEKTYCSYYGHKKPIAQ